MILEAINEIEHRKRQAQIVTQKRRFIAALVIFGAIALPVIAAEMPTITDPMEQALASKLFREYIDGLKCQAQLIQAIRERDAAKKELDNLKKPAEHQ